MKHMELHILQSVPVTCLNRDDLNSPKTAIFGGVQRARVSSQSWKRAIRELSWQFDQKNFMGKRSRRMVFQFSKKLVEKGIPHDVSVYIAEYLATIIETLDSKTDNEGFRKIKTMMFFSDAEYQAVADAVSNEIVNAAEICLDSYRRIESLKREMKNILEDARKEEAKNELKKSESEHEKNQKALAKEFTSKAVNTALKSVHLKDAADIALFGRMVANDPSLNVEGASLFSHALSTHKVDNEIDFFAAVDDLQTKEESGAGMTGTLEFNSATYYRFAAVNLDMLADDEHLACMTREERQVVVRTFLQAVIQAVPSARKNTMNGATLPVYVLGVVREKGHPIQLVNAFENPVRSSQGYAAKSIELLKSEYNKLAETWGISAAFEQSIPDVDMKAFLDGLVDHVI